MQVHSPSIKSISFYNPRNRYTHTYNILFAFYPIFLTFKKWEEWEYIFLALVLGSQSLIWLSCHWTVNCKALFTCTKVGDFTKANLVKVITTPNHGSNEIVKMEKTLNTPTFTFQKKKFLYDSDKKAFYPQIYPIDEQQSIGYLLSSKGNSTAQVSEFGQKYGTNTFDIPVPSFSTLFKEHAVAPFFVFQIFCVGLWCLDEYWYYSLFTLFMLVVFESTVVWTRQRTLQEFRTMNIVPFAINTYRDKKWVSIKSDELVPGDIVSIVGGKEGEDNVPCDVALISGEVIVNEAMLSGESTPLLKESISLRAKDEIFDTVTDKNTMLYGGTKVVQVNPQVETNTTGTNPPDNGAIGLVVRTGFETSQGDLVRTMIFATERVTQNNAEAFYFILFLLVFAIAAAQYVYREGIRMERKKSKLVLDCILIITSVVPPELPMELTLAVNTSLQALSKFAIYCTEPFRIPLAGKVDICAFDKTGTLTAETLVTEGVAGLSPLSKGLINMKDVKDESTLAMGLAHSAVRMDDGKLIGDPMDLATLQSLEWTLSKNNVVIPHISSPFSRAKIQIRRRFQFLSALKRQSTISGIQFHNEKHWRTFAAVKGAPETIRERLTSVPADYDETYQFYGRKGSRVIALGYRFLQDNMSNDKINSLQRDDIEKDLTFAGFVVFHCPLKPDAVDSVKMLINSTHRCIMITGDNPLTASHVARQVGIVRREIVVLDEHKDQTKVLLHTIDDKVQLKLDPKEEIDSSILQKYDLCVTGAALEKFSQEVALSSILANAWVYARVSPNQKEFILTKMKDDGYTTLMCGDGTNDVGALKQAHIGIALLNGSEEDLKRIAEHQRQERIKDAYEKQKSIMKRFGHPEPNVPPVLAQLYPPGPNNPHRKDANGVTAPADQKALTSQNKAQNGSTKTKADKAKQNQEQMQNKMFEMLQDNADDGGPPSIKLGDASVASPFTSKLANVAAVTHIVRQGRCTLVAMIQMYKILALNCLTSAYSLSVLHLDGVKYGDGQVTISGMLMSPVEILSRERPQTNVFNYYIMGSILTQFAVHTASMIYISRYIKILEPPKPVDLESEFAPNLLNTGIYLLSLTQQVSTFAINYQGRPFRESIRENNVLYWGLTSVAAIAFSCSTEFVPEINEKLRLVQMTNEFKVTLTSLMIIDFAACWLLENIFKYLFSNNKPKSIAPESIDEIIL